MHPLEITLSQLLLAGRNPLREDDEAQLTLFLDHAERRMLVEELDEKLKRLMKDWKAQMLLRDLTEIPLQLPNAVQGKPYEATLNLTGAEWSEIANFGIENATTFGLEWNGPAGRLSGRPNQSGTLQLEGFFTLKNASETRHPKSIALIVNPDPRSLWQDLGCDPAAPYFKANTNTLLQNLNEDRTLVMASRRGRSHANVGDFLEDDFAAKAGPQGWTILAISDGAGSAEYAREGSRLAVNTAVEKLEEQLRTEDWELVEDAILKRNFSAPNNCTTGFSEALQKAVFQQLKGIPQMVYQRIEAEAVSAGRPISNFNATLVFTLFKAYPSGTVFLTFGVGDCPAVVLAPEGSGQAGGGTEAHLLNRIDAGESAGSTRFVTMQNVFTSPDFAARFTCHFFPRFDKLVLMTDGIYDAKFPSEASLTQPQYWDQFWEDLAGKNEEGAQVNFTPQNRSAGEQLLEWLLFWSPGNHDDRTLAVVF